MRVDGWIEVTEPDGNVLGLPLRAIRKVEGGDKTATIFTDAYDPIHVEETVASVLSKIRAEEDRTRPLAYSWQRWWSPLWCPPGWPYTTVDAPNSSGAIQGSVVINGVTYEAKREC